MNKVEKAQELVNKFSDYVHGYVGSSMLSNFEYSDQILSQAKKVALINVDQIIFEYKDANTIYLNKSYRDTKIKFWESVKVEINKLEVITA